MNDGELPTEFILHLPHDAMTMLEAAERFAPNLLERLRRASSIGDKVEERRLHDLICVFLLGSLQDRFFAYYEIEPLSNKWKWIPMASLRSAWIVDLEKGRIVSPSFDLSDVRLAPMASRPRPIGRERENIGDGRANPASSAEPSGTKPKKERWKTLSIEILYMIWDGCMTRQQAAHKICEILKQKYGKSLKEDSVYRYIGDAYNGLRAALKN